MGPGQVGADRVLSAGPRLAALVHIDTAGRHVGRVVGPALLAHAEGLCTLRLAEGVLAAGDPAAGLGGAGHAGRTPDKGRQAAAGVAPSRVPTHRVGTADPGRQQTLIRVQTECARRGKPSPEKIVGFTQMSAVTKIPKILPADALSAVALGVVGAVEVGPAAGADLGSLAGHVGVAAVAGRALAGIAGGRVATYSAHTARVLLE